MMVLRVHPDLECGSVEHLTVIIVAIFGVLVYVIGFPAALVFSLKRVDKAQEHAIAHRLEKYGFLYDIYEPHA